MLWALKIEIEEKIEFSIIILLLILSRTIGSRQGSPSHEGADLNKNGVSGASCVKDENIPSASTNQIMDGHNMGPVLGTYSNWCTMLQKLSKCEVRHHLVKIWWFYHHSSLTWNQILADSTGQKMSFLAILEVLILDFSKFEQFLHVPTFKVQSIKNWIKRAIFQILILPKVISRK